MTATRRLAAISRRRLLGEDEAGTARAVAIETSTVTIFNDRFTSRRVIPACKTQADCAKTPRRIKRSPNFAACGRAEQKISRKLVLCAAVQTLVSSFRTLGKNCARAHSGRKSGSFERDRQMAGNDSSQID